VNAKDAWDAALNQLEVHLDRASFNTWLRGSVCLGCDENLGEPARFTIGVRNTFARDMLQHRLYITISRILGDIYGRPVEITFEVKKAEPVTFGEQADMPLFRLLAQQDPSDAPTPLHQQVARPQRPDLPESELNPRFTFDRFVVGNTNRLVYSAAQAVAENPASVYNPLLIYGGVGLGKTHLLQAIAHTCRRKNLNVIYIPSEAFINDLVNAIRQRTTAMFREKYRSLDVLLVDDIQFIAGKESTQEEFFHTFNALYTFNKQIVLASDRHPRELDLLEDRLRSRFEGGLLMDVQLPDFETRVAIVESWAHERGITVTRAVSEMLADRVRSNIRELEGLFTQIVAKSQMNAKPLTVIEATGVMERFERPRNHGQRRVLSLDQILNATSRHYDLSLDDLLGQRRTGRINHARQVAMYLARELTEYSLPQIGEAFGGRSHTTVLHGCTKVAEMMVADDSFRYEVIGLREKLLKG
jgi:chromosomal replication initiator protein